MTRRIYLDNSATTPVDPEVIQAMLPFLSQDFGNASSVHGFGQRARSALESARNQVARLIGATAGEIIFTSGGTEADNLAIKGSAEALREQGRHIITSAIEHAAVLNSCAELEKRGFEVTRLPVNPEGLVSVDQVLNALREDTILITLMAANNEIGALLPVVEIGQALASRRAASGSTYPYFHTDAVQAVGKVPVDVRQWHVDLLSLSGHKIHAPKGVGALYLAQGTRIVSQQHGGHHERDRRAGTENVPGAVALGKAAELARIHLAERA
ncbi:MAG: cysteine desulfurase, partial [Acidobacteria bacterium]|nr:cysteine desulfurase [Acidobacteriota bacterium]